MTAFSTSSLADAIEDAALNLAAAWLAIAPLYVIGVMDMTEPRVAFIAATASAVGVTLVRQGGQTHRRSRPQRPRPERARPGSEPIDAVWPARIANESPEAPPAPPDWSAYALRAVDEMQCRWCGSFDLALPAGGDLERLCRICGRATQTDHTEDVIVRSWLHR